MNACLDKIQVSQKLVQSFISSFLDNQNAYDMYHIGILLRTLSYHVSPSSVKRGNYTRVNIKPELVKTLNTNSIRYKLALKTKDWQDFVIWQLRLPTWTSYFSSNDKGILTKWLYNCFRNRIHSAFNSILPSIFSSIARLHRIRIIDEMATVPNWSARFNAQTLIEKICNVLDFSDENANYLNPEDHIFLIKRRIPDRSIVRGYTCRIDTMVLNFTTNRLMGSELVNQFYA
jgi:hypothetical protein